MLKNLLPVFAISVFLAANAFAHDNQRHRAEMNDRMRFIPAEITLKRGEIGWQFTKAEMFFFGCLIAGQFEAGMIGKVEVVE